MYNANKRSSWTLFSFMIRVQINLAVFCAINRSVNCLYAGPLFRKCSSFSHSSHHGHFALIKARYFLIVIQVINTKTEGDEDISKLIHFNYIQVLLQAKGFFERRTPHAFVTSGILCIPFLKMTNL